MYPQELSGPFNTEADFNNIINTLDKKDYYYITLKNILNVNYMNLSFVTGFSSDTNMPTSGTNLISPKNDEVKVTYKNGSNDKTTFKVEEKKATIIDKEDNPNTLDNVVSYVALGFISIILLIGSSLYVKTDKIQNYVLCRCNN